MLDSTLAGRVVEAQTWEMPGACGLRPCARTLRKKAFATLARKVGRTTNTSADYFSRGPNHFGDRLILDWTSPGAG